MSFVDGFQSNSPTSFSYLVPHPKIEGLFIGIGNALYTKNLVPGEAHTDEILLSIQDKDGREVEYREWNPSKSKLAAAILSGADNIWIKRGSHVLYLGVECGTTISHISDLVGPEGMVYVAEFTRKEPLVQESDKTLMKMAAKRFNIVPIIGQSRAPCQYRMLVNVVDVIFATVDSHVDRRSLENRARVIAANFLKGGGHYVICVKASIEVLFHRTYYKQFGFTPLQRLTLNEDHAYDVGVFRVPELDINPIPEPLIQNPLSSSSSSCTAIMDPKEHADDPSRAKKRRKNEEDDKFLFYFQSKLEIPTYFLFETPCGLSLIRAPRGLKEVVGDSDYKDAEKLANRFDEFFEVVCFEVFESPSEGLIQCKALFKEGIVTNKVKNFLERLLPEPTYDASRKPCYSLVLSSCKLANSIAIIKQVCVRSGRFYNDITRAFRMNIGNIIPGLGPGDLEKAQREMAIGYSKEMIKEATPGRRSKSKQKV